MLKVGHYFVLFPGAGDREAEFEEHEQTGKVRAGSLRQLLLVLREHSEEKLWEDMGEGI